MANPHTELLEIILRECANAQPHPWYPSNFARSTGVPREALEASLDQLRLSGLVKLTEWMKDHGQGYLLTPEGAEVLRQPRLLARLREGDVPRLKPAAPIEAPQSRHALEGLRSEKVRDALLDGSRPLITQILLVLNCLWFLVGLAYCVSRYGGEVITYLNGFVPDLKVILAQEDTGSLSIVDVIDRQQWWRLLSYGFLHAGILHLGMNMYGLYVLGPLLERMWGRAAFLAIYLLSCIGGGAAALMFKPDAFLVGASGALCGLLGSMATWVYLNRNYLPPHIVSAWRSNLLTNVVLIGVISFLPGVSLAGHAGGGLTGLVISAPLCAARFGTGPQRWLGWVGMAAMAVIGLCLTYPVVMKFADTVPMQRLRARDSLIRQQFGGMDQDGDGAGTKPRQKEQRAPKLAEKYPVVIPLLDAEEKSIAIANAALPVLNAEPGDLDPAKTKATKKSIRDQRKKLENAITSLREAGGSGNPALDNAIKAGLAFFGPALELGDKTAKVCDAGRMTDQEKQDLTAEFHALTSLRRDFVAQWNKVQP